METLSQAIGQVVRAMADQAGQVTDAARVAAETVASADLLTTQAAVPVPPGTVRSRRARASGSRPRRSTAMRRCRRP